MNQYFTQTDNQILQMILKDWNLRLDQLATFKEQIQYFEKPSDLFTILLESKNNWITLQENIRAHLNSNPKNLSKKPPKYNFSSDNQGQKCLPSQQIQLSQQNSQIQDNYPKVVNYQKVDQQFLGSRIGQTNYQQMPPGKNVFQQISQKQKKIESLQEGSGQLKSQTDLSKNMNSNLETGNQTNNQRQMVFNSQPIYNYNQKQEIQSQKYAEANSKLNNQNKIINEKSFTTINQSKNFKSNEGNQQVSENNFVASNGKAKIESQNLIPEANINPIKSNIQFISKDYFSSEARKEFENLNQQDFSHIYEMIDEVFQTLLGGKKQKQQNIIFSKNSELTVSDLLNLCIVVEKLFTYYPRAVQLMSVILLYNHDTNQGRLAQIYTGEGKTLIVAMLAVLLCKKRNCNVDIVTSSAVLAKRDSQDYAKFYEEFQLKVSHNIHKDQVIEDGVLPCYNCQIIYGDASSFQGDILRHEYSEQGTMGNRKQQYAIIDEVDSMLIDGHRNKTLLSSPIPGMLDLSKVLQLIWDEICKVQPSLSTNFEVMIIDKDDYYSVSLEEYIEQTLDKQLKDYVKNFIPNFRLNYINHMKKTWIKNAISAKFYLKNNKDYIINDDSVRIVDYQNTGVIQSGNTQWEKGLHQFIQLKHNLNVTPLSISTNYLSNISFFKRYKEKLLGLTGTLGSENTQNLLAKQYQVDFIYVPPFKKRNLQEQFSEALNSEDEWLRAIYKAVQGKMQNKRAVLIINKTIQEAEKIVKTLEGQNAHVIKYTDDSQVISKDIGPKTIVVATNLAGRGTDFITNQELEDNGGLHIIMSFLPQNIRTQEQGFGRTCRQGKKGSAQLLVQFKQNLYLNPEQIFENYGQAIDFYRQQNKDDKFNLIDVLKFFRDQNEKYYMEQIEQDMYKLLNEDKCFEKFCQIAKKKVNFKQNRQAFRSLEEKWGLYLEINQEKGIQVNEIEQFLNQEENQNPKYLIFEALEQNDLKKITKAAQEIKDPQAQYYKGMLEIDNEKYQEGAQSLLKAKQLFLEKIENEKEFATAVKINQQQIQYFCNEDEFEEKKKDPININNFEKQQSFDFEPINPQNIEKPQQDMQKDKQIKQNKDRIGEKVENHIKVYQKVIDNIDDTINTLKTFNPEKDELELEWVKVIDKDGKKTKESESAIKDQQEVINDGPLPRLGQIKKTEKKTTFWGYAGLLFLGCCQYALGAYLNTHFCGAVIPLAKSLMKEGLSDMTLALVSGLKGLDIDWDAWGEKKIVEACGAVCRAGVYIAREEIEKYQQNKQRQIDEKNENIWKTLKGESMNSYLDKINPKGVTDYYKKCSKYLTDEQKVQIENTNQTLQKVQEFTLFNLNTDELCKMAQEVIDDQVLLGAISSKTGGELSQVFSNSMSKAQETKGDLCENLINMGQKYLRAQIGQKKAEQMQEGNNQVVIQHSQNLCRAKHDVVKNQIDDFKIYKQRLSNELNNFSTIFWNCFKKDEAINKKLIAMDLYLELLCDFKLAQSQINDSNVQQIIRQNFNMNDNQLQQACKQLKISNQASMMQFYEGQMSPLIQKFIEQLFTENKITEPLEIILKQQISIQKGKIQEKLKVKNKELENKKSQIQKFQQNLNQRNLQRNTYYDQMINAFNSECDQLRVLVNQNKEIQEPRIIEITQSLITYLVQNRIIKGNGLSYSQNILEETRNFLANNNKNPLLYEIFEQAMIKSIEKGQTSYLTCKKLFSTLLKSSIDLQVLDPIKKYIFQSRLSELDRQIIEKLN